MGHIQDDLIENTVQQIYSRRGQDRLAKGHALQDAASRLKGVSREERWAACGLLATEMVVQDLLANGDLGESVELYRLRGQLVDHSLRVPKSE